MQSQEDREVSAAANFFNLIPEIIPRTPSPDITYPYPLFKQEADAKRRELMKPNQVGKYTSTLIAF